MSDSSADDEEPPPKKVKSLPECSYGAECYRKNPKHFEEFSHPLKDHKATKHDNDEPTAGTSSSKNTTTNAKPLPKCQYGAQCYRKNPIHFAEYSHQADESDSGSDTDNYYSGDDTVDEKSSKSLVKKLSQLNEEEQRELLKSAVQAKEQLEKELEETKSDVKKRDEELKSLLTRMNKETLLMEGEKEALEKDDSKAVYFDLQPERSYKEGSASQFHLRLAESQFYRLLRGQGTTVCQVKKVQYVVNPKLVKQFKKSQEDMCKAHGGKDVHTILAFHGIEEKNINSICEKGFCMSDQPSGKFGRGAHFSEYPGSSIQFIKKASTLLLCQILPGKVYSCPDEMPDAELEEGYDSHRSPGGKEIVIFHSDRILPCYIVHYRRAMTEFVYKAPAELKPKHKDPAYMAKLYKKAQRTRKYQFLWGKHIRLCGTLTTDHETIGRLIRKFGGFYVDNEPPYCEPGETIPLHDPNSLGFYPFKGKYLKIFNILICSEKEFKSKKNRLFGFIEEANDAYDVGDIDVVREDWLYDSILENLCKNTQEYEWD